MQDIAVEASICGYCSKLNKSNKKGTKWTCSLDGSQKGYNSPRCEHGDLDAIILPKNMFV
jgi:hypothetical protein